MDMSRFSKTNGQFSLLDLTAKVEFMSYSSLSFDIGRLSNTLRLPTDEHDKEVGFSGERLFVSIVIGWIDVHHPCDGHIKTQLRIRLPAEYHLVDQMKSIIHRIFEVLDIPLDETYEAVFFTCDRITGIEQATNREGMTDRLY
jgi:hypothetical protein